MYFLDDMREFFGSEAGQEGFDPNMSELQFRRKVIGQLVLSPGVLAIGLYRLSRWFWVRGQVIPSRVVDRINEGLTGAQLPGQADIGPGLQVHHPPSLVVAPETVAGKRFFIMGGVSLGVRDVKGPTKGQCPTFGDDVMLGTGAKILGPVHLGDRVQVAANSVVMIDVPDDGIAVGMPARVINKNGDRPPREDAPAAET